MKQIKGISGILIGLIILLFITGCDKSFSETKDTGIKGYVFKSSSDSEFHLLLDKSSGRRLEFEKNQDEYFLLTVYDSLDVLVNQVHYFRGEDTLRERLLRVGNSENKIEYLFVSTHNTGKAHLNRKNEGYTFTIVSAIGDTIYHDNAINYGDSLVMDTYSEDLRMKIVKYHSKLGLFDSTLTVNLDSDFCTANSYLYNVKEPIRYRVYVKPENGAWEVLSEYALDSVYTSSSLPAYIQELLPK